MRELGIKASRFPTARCDTCDKSVLTYISFGVKAEGQRACVHCDTPIGDNLQWVSEAELAADGYQIGSSPPGPRGSCGGGCSCSARSH